MNTEKQLLQQEGEAKKAAENNKCAPLSVQEYQTLVNKMNDIVCKADSKGNISYVNDIASEILQMDIDHIIGKNVFDFIPESEQKRTYYHFLHHFLSDSCVQEKELLITTENGHAIWLGVTVKFDGRNNCKCKETKGTSSNTTSPEDAVNLNSFNEIIIIAHDITERRKTRRAVEKSEKRYRELTEFLPEMICELDTKGNVTYFNDFALNKTGYSREDLLNGPFNIAHLFSKEEHAIIQKRMISILTEGLSLSSEYVAIKKNGETFPVIVYTSPIYDQTNIIGIRGVMIDITERKKNEEQTAKNLRKQEILSEISLSFNSLDDFESKITDALKIIGEHTQVSRVYFFKDNSSGLKTSKLSFWYNSGMEVDETLQNIEYSKVPSWKPLLDEKGFIKSTNITELPQDIQDRLIPQGVKSILAFPLRVSGKYFGFIRLDECMVSREWTNSEIELIRTISNILSNAQLRNNIQADLIFKEHENRVILESIPDQIISFTKDGLISYKSSQKDNFLGLDEDLNGQRITDLVDAELSSSFSHAIEKCLNRGAYRFEFSYLKWEDLKNFEARFVKLNEDEVLAIIQDVSEIKEKEKQLQLAKNKAEEASRAKSEFLANVSHEIRTPMNAILGFSEWLYDNVTEEQHKNYLHIIMSSGRNLLALINDILDLSKIESGKMDIELEPMRSRIVLQEIKQVLKQKVESKNITLQITIDPSVPEYVYMDEIRFYQIIFNIANNAIKFTPKGYVHISAYTTKTSEEDIRNLVIVIEDTGIGIKEDQQEKIFTAFTQQSGQSNRYYEGTGLGLSIVSGLLKKLNGKIKLSSKIGKGSTFTVTFKDVRVAEVQSDSGDVASEHNVLVLEPCHILIVDDIKFNRDVLKQIIGTKNITYHEACSGEEALEIMQNTDPNLIFMDIRMSGLSGFDVTEIIKNNEKQKNIPIVAFTASTMQDDTNIIEELFDAFLQKPVNKNEVIGVVKKFLKYRYNEIEDIEAEEMDQKEETIDLVSEECIKILPELIQTLEEEYLVEWETIRNDLVIFDIEDFCNKLSEFIFGKSCLLLEQYCRDLNLGVQSFDIEVIEKKLNEFPDVIAELKTYL